MNAARPKLAEIPQNSEDAAMYAYPLIGCFSVCKEFFNSVPVETNDDLFTDYCSRSLPALVFEN